VVLGQQEDSGQEVVVEGVPPARGRQVLVQVVLAAQLPGAGEVVHLHHPPCLPPISGADQEQAPVASANPLNPHGSGIPTPFAPERDDYVRAARSEPRKHGPPAVTATCSSPRKDNRVHKNT
jgi:hypothetical protein